MFVLGKGGSSIFGSQPGIPCLAAGARVSSEAPEGQLCWQPRVSLQHCARPTTDTPDWHHAHHY